MGITVILPDGSGVPGPRVELAGSEEEHLYSSRVPAGYGKHKS